MDKIRHNSHQEFNDNGNLTEEATNKLSKVIVAGCDPYGRRTTALPFGYVCDHAALRWQISAWIIGLVSAHLPKMHLRGIERQHRGLLPTFNATKVQQPQSRCFEEKYSASCKKLNRAHPQRAMKRLCAIC